MADIRTTPLLDDFNGADENPLANGGLWGPLDTDPAGPVGPSGRADNLRREGGAARGFLSIPDRFWTRYWTPSPFSGEWQIWGKLDSALAGGDWCGLAFLTDSGGFDTSPDGYISYVRAPGGNNDSLLYRYDNWAATLVASDSRAAFLAADSLLLFQTNGTGLETYYSNDDGANWTALISAVDNTYRSTLWMSISFVGMFAGATGWIGFGGGNPGNLATINQLPYLGVGP